MKNKSYVPIQTAANSCGINTSILCQWIGNGELEIVHSPRGLLVCVEDLRKYLQRDGMPVPKELRPAVRIMVVEDEAVVSKIIMRIMRKLWPDAEIMTVNHGKTAAAKMLTFQPDLILLDLGLPGLNGLEICRMVREQRELAHTKVIVLTGSTDWGTNWRAIENGADEFLTKPFEPRELCNSAMRLMP